MIRATQRWPLIAALIGALVLAGIALVVVDRVIGGSTAVATIGGPFQLTDQDGRPVSEASYRGKWLLIYFGYTHCPDACPTALNDMAEAIDRLGGKRPKVQALFVTVDPERDTPAVLKDYVAAFGDAVVGLTGTPDQIQRAARAYRVYYAKHAGASPGEYDMDHSSVIYVMDPQGRFVTNFTHESPPELIAQRLNALIS
ncbi:MAG: SCO family protein [Proteobacteria bacterium]|nr:SCO family protein [Pseudomonadota bacterium]MBI3497112.1 SCO family protein [Pseudomonadota bacterium]